MTPRVPTSQWRGKARDELVQMRFGDIVGRTGSMPRPFHAMNVHLRNTSWCVRRADYVEVFAVTAGRGRQMVQAASGRRFTRRLHEGEMFFYRPSDVTSLSVTGPTGLEASVVMIPRANWETFAAFIGLDESWSDPEEPPTMTFDAVDPEQWRPFSDALEHSRAVPTRVDLLQFLVEVIPRMLPVSPASAPGAGAPPWLSRSVAAMQEDDENLRGGVARLTALAHVSGQYLATCVRRYYGTTPTALVRGLRLRRAVVLLTSTSASVGEIAARCGYATLSHFSNSFRESYHVTPREYRARERQPVAF